MSVFTDESSKLKDHIKKDGKITFVDLLLITMVLRMKYNKSARTKIQYHCRVVNRPTRLGPNPKII